MNQRRAADRRLARSRSTWLALALGLLVVTAIPAGAETFDLHIRSFCPPTSNCGADSEEEYEALVIEMVEYLNQQWAIKGFSFRPVIFPIDSSDPHAYSITGCDAKDQANPYSCSNDADDFCADDSGCSGGGTCQPTKFCADLSTRCLGDSECSIAGGRCLPLNKQRRWRLRDLYAAPERDAITMLLFNKATWCCAAPPSSNAADNEISAIFCDARRGARQGGSVFAHEMGHYWCLRHTFTGAEWIDDMFEPDHDGDDPYGVFDTPSDPKRIEKEDRTPRCSNDNSVTCDKDADCSGGGVCDKDIFKFGHDFCTAAPFDDTDPGSLNPEYCTSSCVRCDNDICGGNFSGSLGPTGYAPFEHNAMSYYGWSCRAPFSRGGQPYFAFTFDQLGEIATCRTSWQRRIDLPDVCANRGGDADHDGICQDDDNCPGETNTGQADFDGDGEGDLCDLCPEDPTPTGDLDGDGLGDACDPDRDDDGCDNDVDQEPDEKMQVFATTFVEGPCESDQYRNQGYAGDDTDGDGVLNCEDVDDDNDGICDEDETWSGAGPGAPFGCSQGPDTCPRTCDTGPNNCPDPFEQCIRFEAGADCIDPWLGCIGGDCNEFYALWTPLVNPDPTQILRFDNIQLYGRTMYATSPPTMTPASAALQLSGQAFATRGAGASFRLELWRVGGTEPEAILIDSYTPSDAVMGQIDAGQVLVLEQRQDSDGNWQIHIRTDWAIGGRPLYGNDDDDIPAFADNCSDRYNPDQRDSDGDGFGDACDADVDNDGIVSQADLALIQSCDGVDVTREITFGEPADYDIGAAPDAGLEIEPTDPAIVDEVLRCRNLDLDGNGVVNFQDVNEAQQWLDNVPGPSGRVDRAPVADAGPDRSILCGSSIQVDAGESFDPDGATLTCHWSSNSCGFENPDSCSTFADCPDGGLHTITLEVSDGNYSVFDSFQVDAGSCSPGQAGRSLRVSKAGSDDVRLIWERECQGNSSGIVRWGVYEGRLSEATSSIQSRLCNIATGQAVVDTVLTPAHADSFFLVVPGAGPYEGSFGADGDGNERQPPTAGRCRSAQALPVCPAE